jgi:sigma-B regulation protein RsbU (phosphoserine phosphatase)
MMAVPLQTADRVIGLIYVDMPNIIREFTPEDLNLLTVMANVAAIRIEHARLAEVEQSERLMERDMQQAALIQKGLLPTAAPEMAGLDIAGFNTPSRIVGGDYYDFLTYQDGRVAVLVGDAAGKGMPASLLISRLQAQVQVLFEEPDPLAEQVARLNRFISLRCPGNRFITLFVGLFDSNTGQIAYCNAGHNPPLLIRRNGGLDQLTEGGLVLGLLPNTEYAAEGVAMEPGDIVVLFSDGITEAFRKGSDEEYGEDRLARVVRQNQDKSAQAIIDAIYSDLTEWTSGAPPADDMTLVVVKRL